MTWRAKFVALILLFLAVAACGNSKEDARMKLGEKKVTYSPDIFVNRAREGDLEVVFIIA